ncbi:MAG: hypothetical protein CMJ59_00555 [Planctomycetaceae bacterium]|nr:hypothetical protein [Planctomycetaceae bacterium]
MREGGPIGLRVVALLLTPVLVSRTATGQQPALSSGHPRSSYEEVADIEPMASALRCALSLRERYSFSRGWWQWDRLRSRYVDGGRTDRNAIKILAAVFRGLIFDWHRRLQSRGEGDLLYLFFTTNPGDKGARRTPGGRSLVRDLHGGGYHGGWGGAARMRIYEELVRQQMLTADEQLHFRSLVRQSFSHRFLDFSQGHQRATNHAFGNAGGPAIALRLFPELPQAAEARGWLDRIWRDFSEYGDWKEWTYYPYGPIFLHGLIDVAQERGAQETQRELLYAVGQRCLGFVHGGGVRANPNSYAPAKHDRAKLDALYRDPWQLGYFDVEQSARDGHFWYRMAKWFRDPEFLWAAEQVALGGRPPTGELPAPYRAAYARRFGWFVDRNIIPRVPQGGSSVGWVSPRKHRIPERLYVCAGRGAGLPFASAFVYDGVGSHLNPPEVWGTLIEYSVDGVKFLGSAGKYTDDIPGGSGAYDSLMVSPPDLQFPLDGRGPQRSGRLERSALRFENRGAASFGQFAFVDYFGLGSRWTRQLILTAGGVLVVRDEYQSGPENDGHQVGPCWQCRGEGERMAHAADQHWFDAPAWDRAWWQSAPRRVLVYTHPAQQRSYRVARHRTSQDISRSVPTDAFAPAGIARAGVSSVFLTVLVPHPARELPASVMARIQSRVDAAGNGWVAIDEVTVSIAADGQWAVGRVRAPR